MRKLFAVAINKGTPTEPKFDAPAELKGTNLWANNVRPPANWTIDPGNNRANLYAHISVSEDASPGGGKVLKSGYFPSPNKVIKMTPLIVDGVDSVDFFRYWWDQWYPMNANWSAGGRVTNFKGRDVFPFDLTNYSGGKVPFLAASPNAQPLLLAELQT